MRVSSRLLGLLEAFTVVVLIFGTIALVFLMLNPHQPLAVDFAPLWAASVSPSDAYDTAAITHTQMEVFGMQLGPRPFAYPPTALFLLSPLGSLPFFIAYVVFVSVGFAMFVWTSMRAGSPWWIAVFPPVILLVHVGQPTLLVGGLMLAGFLLSDWRLRGLLFGIAVAIKPQLCLFLPLALLLERDWRTALLTVAAVCGFAIAATGTFGISVWQEWIAATTSLRAFVLSSPSLSANMIHTSPIFFAIPAALLVWANKDADNSVRFSTTVGAALLVSPYAMNYELALLAPAVASFARKTPWMMIAALFLGLGFFIFELGVLVAVLAALVWASWSSGSGSIGPGFRPAHQDNFSGASKR